MKSRRVLLTCAVLAATCGAASGASSWPAAIWNPVPAAGDVVLPLPCGGSIALRPVITHRVDRRSSEVLLSDTEVQLGRGDSGLGFVDQLRRESLAGSFTNPDGDHYFLIGKYELTAEQYDVVMRGGAGACPPPPAADAGYPKVDLGWYDAIEFTRKLNRWLYASAAESLPKVGSAVAFARLPTETEWEFAARGGLSVSDAARIAEADTLQPSLADHAWFSESQLEKSVRRIGKKKANPLGIYDMLGNADELVFDGFQMNKVGRRHGQIGGIVLRGGAIRDSEDFIRFSARKELPLMNAAAKDETRSPTIGMRLVLGTVAIHNDVEIEQLKKEFQLASRQTSQAAPSQPLQEMEALLRRQNDETSRRMQQLTAELRAEFRRRNELEVRATSSILREAVRILAEIEIRADKARSLEENLKSDLEAPLNLAYTQEEKDRAVRQDRDAIDREVKGMVSIAPVYRDDLHVLAYEFNSRIREAFGQMSGFYSAQSRPDDIRRLEIVVRQIDEYKTNRLPTEKALLRSSVGDGSWAK